MMTRLDKYKSLRGGFTLVELSIVLIIIGLLTAGILVGRDLIRAAQMRAQIAQLNELDTAVNAFRLKYNCLPGDCADAVEQGLGSDSNPGANGDGNGVLDVDIILTVHYNLSTPEPANFWYHLSQAGMLAGNYPGYTGSLLIPGVDTPPLKMPGTGPTENFWTGPNSYNSSGGLCVVYPTQVINHLGDPVFNFGTKHVVYLSSRCDGFPGGLYRAPDAYNMDTKIDDGLPKSGRMQSFMYGLITWDLFEDMFLSGGCIKTLPTGKVYDPKAVNGDGYLPFCSPLIQMNF